MPPARRGHATFTALFTHGPDLMKNLSIHILLAFCLPFIITPDCLSQDPPQAGDAPEDRWADSVLSTLSLKEKIAQLMIIRANNPNQPYLDVISSYIKEYNIGGVTFFGGHPVAQALQTNTWQALAKTPMFISIDGEWGPAMRLDSMVSFPYQMTLGAIRSDSLIYRMGLEVARQCKALGIHINFAPVVDINSNPANPVIHMRSFGENREDVARKGIMYMKGMQDGGLIVTAKHFPGHGDTGTDSHHTLPLVPHSRQRIDSLEAYPFRELINAGLDGIMIAHLNVPALEENPNTPSTLSRGIVTGYLREELGFDGLIVTDALDMKGVTGSAAPGDIEVRALLAGNDILLLSASVPAAVNRVMKAVETGEISEELINERCRKVLRYKYKAGLGGFSPVSPSSMVPELNHPASVLVTRQLFEEAVTIARDDRSILPLQGLDTLRIASVSTGYGRITPFQERLQYYAPVTAFSLSKEPSEAEVSMMLDRLKEFSLVIIAVQNTSIWGGSPYGIHPQVSRFIRECATERKIILDLFSTPYALKSFENLPPAAAVIMSYQDHPQMQDVSAQVIFGGIPATGTLPVTASGRFPQGTGLFTDAIRLKYALPEELGISSQWLHPIDSLVKDCIDKRIFPGCQVWAAKDGVVFLARSYGAHTYENKNPVGDFDLYDVASLTKIAATTLSVMRLQDEGKIDIDRQLVAYMPDLEGSNKARIIIREMMAHQARLKPWIPFYKYTLLEGKPDSTIYRQSPQGEFDVRVAENLYIRESYKQAIFDSIRSSALLRTNNYKYSDLGFIYLAEIIGSLAGKSIDNFTHEQFYAPLGLSTTGYLPRYRFPLNRIIPTEQDKVFRNQLVHGDVHDPAAAMLGGVSGHAGLFSNANDMGILGQMLLNRGSYAGLSYIRPETIQDYTSYQFPLNSNRRGVGFDKPLPEFSTSGPVCQSASKDSFGHSGFTGTYLWVDPANGLVYVFLSNRVYPDAENNKLSGMNIREKIHEYLYDAIKKSAIFAPGNN